MIVRTYFARAGGKRIELKKSTYQLWKAQQAENPVRIAAHSNRWWWWFQGRFFLADRDYPAQDVAALVLAKESKDLREVQRAKAYLARGSEPRRMPIPPKVSHEVLTRDGGRCVICGEQKDLQFDHIIPVAMGGATTAENLQVLCAPCNRDKGANLA